MVAAPNGVLSAYTGFVATRTEAGEPVKETLVVPNALPQGWSEEFITFGSPSRGIAFSLRRASGPITFSAPSMEELGLHSTEQGPCAIAAITPDWGSPSYSRRGYDAPKKLTLFSGEFRLENKGEVVLYDGKANTRGHFKWLEIITSSDAPKKLDQLAPDLTLLIFVDDLSAPLATIRVLDVLSDKSRRPLNLPLTENSYLRVVLVGGTCDIPQIEINLSM